MTPLLSIVTVVKDDEAGLHRTLASIDSSPPAATETIEWLIVDSSSDRQAVNRVLDSAHIVCRYYWVPPTGVYPAMNSGLKEATGTYVLFLNAGDELNSQDVLPSLLDQLRTHSPTWLYGQVAFIDPHETKVTPPPFDYQRERDALFARGRFPPHQGTIASRELLQSLGGFDTNLRVAADYALALRLSQIADPLELNTTIANFHTGGLSTNEWRLSVHEFHRARLEVFAPSGLSRAREQLKTATHFAKLALGQARRRHNSSAH